MVWTTLYALSSLLLSTFSSSQREAQDVGGPLKLLHEVVELPS